MKNDLKWLLTLLISLSITLSTHAQSTHKETEKTIEPALEPALSVTNVNQKLKSTPKIKKSSKGLTNLKGKSPFIIVKPVKGIQKTPAKQMKIACQETDDGRDPSYWGEIKLIAENGKTVATYPDQCLADNVLLETYCDKNNLHQAVAVKCSCKKNACIGPPKLLPE